MERQSLFFKVHLLFLAFLTLSGCSLFEKQYGVKSFPSKSMAKKTKPKEKQTWEQIQTQKTKSFPEKIKDIEAFIKANEDKEIALEAYLLKAKKFLQNKNYKKACLSYHEVVESSFDYTNQWEAYQASAKCHLKEGKLEQALETLEKLIQNPKEKLKNKKVAAKLQWTFLKNKKISAKWNLISLSHLFLFSSQPKEKQIWKNKGEKLINSLSPNELILYAKQAFLFPVFSAYLLYKVGEHFWANKKFAKAKTYFKESLSSEPSLTLKKSIKKKLRLIEKISKINPYLIGVLVPLSGRRKALGEKVLRGLYMGLDMEKDSSWQIIVMDSKSHPDVVSTHLESLLYKHHVAGVIGGLTSETAEVIADKAELFAIPAILFSQKENLSLNRDFIFQNSITAQQLLKPLVNELRKNLKVNTAAVLYSDDLYGKEYAELFSNLFKKQGGKITQYEIYKAGEVDFKKHIKKLLHLNIKGREKEFKKLKQNFLKENTDFSERSHKLTPENLLPAKKEFDALFIPDSMDRLRKIKDHLKYFGVKDIYLLGTDLWKQNQISSWSKDLPLIFVNHPEKDSSLLTNSVFYKEFIHSYSQPPGLFEQRAYNSAIFLKRALSQSVKSRLSLQKELKKIKTFQGAYHKVSVSKAGIFNYPLKLYKIELK